MSVLESDVGKNKPKHPEVFTRCSDAAFGRSSEGLFCISSVFHRKFKDLLVGRSPVQMITPERFQLSG